MRVLGQLQLWDSSLGGEGLRVGCHCIKGALGRGMQGRRANPVLIREDGPVGPLPFSVPLQASLTPPTGHSALGAACNVVGPGCNFFL